MKLTKVESCPCDCKVPSTEFTRWRFIDRQEVDGGWSLRLFRCAAREDCRSYRVIAAKGDCELVMYGVPTKRTWMNMN